MVHASDDNKNRKTLTWPNRIFSLNNNRKVGGYSQDGTHGGSPALVTTI